MKGTFLRELYLARHGETVENLNNIIAGWQGGTLTSKGRKQSRLLGTALRKKGIEIIICADTNRHMETANEINKYLKIPIEYTPFLRERSAGSADGKSFEELKLEKDTNLKPFYSVDRDDVFTDGETLKEVMKRANEASNLLTYLKNETIILAIGSEWINSYIINEILAEEFEFHKQDNAHTHYIQTNNVGGIMNIKYNQNKFRKTKWFDKYKKK